MAGPFSRTALLLALSLAWPAASAQGADPPVVRSEAQLKASLAAGKKTPLDAVTPYGKRSLLDSLQWDEDGVLVGLNTWVVARELDAKQLAALLAYLNADPAYLRILQGALGGPPVRLPEPSPSLEHQVREFDRLAREDATRRRPGNTDATPLGSEKLLADYRRLFGERMTPASLQGQSLGDLLPLFEAADTMNFYHPDTTLPDVLRVHRELAARGVSTVRWFDGRALDALLAARRFDEARSFAAARPALAGRSIPRVADPLGAAFRGRSLYRYDKASDTLTREATPAPAGVQVVMFVQEHCQPTARALKALREDVDMQARLRQANLLLVTDPSASIPFGFIANWNAANPSLPMRATYSVEEWTDVRPTGVPEFFVLKDGKPVGRLVGGWPEEGNKAALMALLDAAAR